MATAPGEYQGGFTGWTARLRQVAAIAAAVCVPAAALAQAPAFTGILLVGASAVPLAQVHRRVAPLVGQPADAALLEKVRKLVAQAHDDAGLGLVAVDPPRLEGGLAIVRVQPLVLRQVMAVTPGATAEPAPASAIQPMVGAVLPGLQPGQTPDLGALDRQLRLANLQPGRRWAVDFRPRDVATTGATGQPAPAIAPAPVFSSKPGQTLASEMETPVRATRALLSGGQFQPGPDSLIDARVTVSDPDPFFGRLSADNAGQAATGRERLRLQLGHTDLLGPGRSIDLTALVSLAHPARQQQMAVRLQNPVPEWATLFALEASYAHSRPGLVQDFFGVSGKSRSLNLSARRLLARQGGLEPYAEVAIETAVHDDVIDFFGTNLGSKVGVAPIALTLGAIWQGGPWSAFGQARLRHNTGWGAHAGAGDYAAARAGASPHWTTMDVVAEARRGLGGGQEVVLRGQAQWSGDALVSPQQFRAGGANLMRGLPEGELAGDRGAAVALEYWAALSAQHRLGALLDWAGVRRNQAQAGEPASAHAASFGVAWHWQIAPALRLQTTAAQVVAARRLPQSGSGDSRVHLLLDWAF
ncbi:MAG: ShlB/FhaC/HecB family hemolysin secretion/activation protein [Haliea sp.]|nr:MAG: ShlB/FhaC/HecB family hemolysin secretion/activation protein [Haliea sp.]